MATTARKPRSPARAPAKNPKLEIVADIPKSENPRRRRSRRKRRRNPWSSLQIGLAVGGAVVVGIALRYAIMRNAAKIAGSITNKDVYYYWAAVVPGQHLAGDVTGNMYAPYIQNARTGEIFTLPDDISEQGALWDAKSEIEKRGGIPQLGHPMT